MVHCELQLFADQPRELDVEPGRIAVRPRIVEGRVVELGQEADLRDARDIRPLGAAARVPEARDRDRSLNRRLRSRRLGRGWAVDYGPTRPLQARPQGETCARASWIYNESVAALGLRIVSCTRGAAGGPLIDEEPGRGSSLSTVEFERPPERRRRATVRAYVPEASRVALPQSRARSRCPELDCLRGRLPPGLLATAEQRALALNIGRRSGPGHVRAPLGGRLPAGARRMAAGTIRAARRAARRLPAPRMTGCSMRQMPACCHCASPTRSSMSWRLKFSARAIWSPAHIPCRRTASGSPRRSVCGGLRWHTVQRLWASAHRKPCGKNGPSFRRRGARRASVQPGSAALPLRPASPSCLPTSPGRSSALRSR